MAKELRIIKTKVLETGQVLRAGTSGRFEDSFAEELIKNNIAREVNRVPSLVGWVGQYMTETEAEAIRSQAKEEKPQGKKTKEEKIESKTKTEK